MARTVSNRSARFGSAEFKFQFIAPVCTGRQFVPSPRTTSSIPARFGSAEFKLQFVILFGETDCHVGISCLLAMT